MKLFLVRSFSGLVIVLGSDYGAVCAQPVDYQKKADATKWQWSDAEACLLFSALEHLNGYEMIIRQPAKTDDLIKPYDVRILHSGNEVYRFRAHPNTVFTRLGNVLYIADFRPIASGSAVIAYDLDQGKQLWRCLLLGNRPNAHSQYRHRINITSEDGIIVVYGDETNGRYVEFVNPRTGKTVGHKMLPPLSK